MKTVFYFFILLFTGMFLLSSCSKESKIYVPISLTDKDGNIFIQIDTVSNSFNAYASTKITQGRLKGIFNDTIQSAFYLAIITNPVWDTVYHPADTNIFPTHYTGHTLIVQANVNLTNYTLPYHFLLLGTPRPALKCGSHGNPSIMLTIDTQND